MQKLFGTRFFAPLLLLLLALLLCAIAIKFTNNDDATTAPSPNSASQIDYGLPIICIDTIDGAAPFSEYKETLFEANMQIYDSQIRPNGGTLYTGEITLKQRGNTSFYGIPKKSFNIKLDYKSYLLDLSSKSKEWCLIANYFDPSLIRNHIAYELARDMGDYAPDSTFVDVIINGVHYGTYLLCEKLTLESKRIGKGGYLVELSKFASENGDKDDLASNLFQTERVNNYDCYAIEEPSKKNLSVLQYKYVAEYMNHFEDVLYSDNWLSPTNGYKNIIDINSIVDTYIINELFNQWDFFNRSTYFYIPDSGLMKLGPIWDFDFSSGNYPAPGFKAGKITDWLSPIIKMAKIRGYMPRFFEDPEFESLVMLRWQEIYPTIIPNMYKKIDESAELIALSQEKNFTLFPFDANPADRNGFDEEIRYLKAWLRARAEFLNSEWGA